MPFTTTGLVFLFAFFSDYKDDKIKVLVLGNIGESFAGGSREAAVRGDSNQLSTSQSLVLSVSQSLCLSVSWSLGLPPSVLQSNLQV